MSTLMEYMRLEFAQIGLVGTLLVALLCGFLSPLVVTKERSYVGDLLAHYVFPGVVVGYFISERWGVPLQAALLTGAAITGFAGMFAAEFIIKRLRTPPDAGSMIVLTGFFAAGVVLVSKAKGTRISLETFLFGDVLALSWFDVALLAGVLVAVVVLIALLFRHWQAWLSDPEFAQLAGFRVRFLDYAFPMMLAGVVLASLFAVGGLMISAMLALPAVLVRPRRVFSGGVLAVSVLLGFSGFVLALLMDWPVGSTIVLLGAVAVFCKSALIVVGR
jgi:ABC-type Mn2+/Zn2+ transport system permease subunit